MDVKEKRGMLPGGVDCGGTTSPARQSVCLAEANHDDSSDGAGVFNCIVGGSECNGSSNRNTGSRRADKSNDNDSGGGSKCSDDDSLLDGEAIRTFARRCLAESRTL